MVLSAFCMKRSHRNPHSKLETWNPGTARELFAVTWRAEGACLDVRCQKPHHTKDLATLHWSCWKRCTVGPQSSLFISFLKFQGTNWICFLWWSRLVLQRTFASLHTKPVLTGLLAAVLATEVRLGSLAVMSQPCRTADRSRCVSAETQLRLRHYGNLQKGFKPHPSNYHISKVQVVTNVQFKSPASIWLHFCGVEARWQRLESMLSFSLRIAKKSIFLEANPDSAASVKVSLASSNANRASCSTKLCSFVMS